MAMVVFVLDSSLAMAASAEILARVERAQRLDRLTVSCTLAILDARKQKLPSTITLRVRFTADAAGRIDWAAPENARKVLALGLAPGDLVSVMTAKRKGRFQASGVALSSAQPTEFSGRGKIADGAILAALSTPPRAQVLVTLEDKDAAPQTDPAQLRAQAARFQDAVLAALAGGDFELVQRLDNAPILTVRVSYAGLRVLAAHPLVLAIEPDRAIELKPMQ